MLDKSHKFITLAFQRIVNEEIDEQFILESASNLIHEFLDDNFKKKISQNFLVKIALQKLMC